VEDKIGQLVKLAEKSLKCYVGTGDKLETTLKKIPTGIPSLDLILKGGLIRGRFHLIQGDFSTGKCIAKNSYIFSTKGIIKIERIEKSGSVYSIGSSVEKYSFLYKDGLNKGIKVTTERGKYSLIGTLEHPILILTENGFVFRKLKDCKIGDWAVIDFNKKESLEQVKLPSPVLREYKHHVIPSIT